MRVLRRGADLLLTLAAVAGVAGLALFGLVQAGFAQTLVVTSGSMRPAYDVGDVLVSRTVDAAGLQPGDVATLRDADGRLITHRVVEVVPGPSPAAVEVVMQGDANDAPDATRYVVTEALVPVVRLPGVGPVVAAVQRPSVAVPSLVAVLALVAMAFVPGGRREGVDAPVP